MMNLRGCKFNRIDQNATERMTRYGLFLLRICIEGQYIIKNLVVISAGIVLGATVRGGKLVA